MVSDQIVDIYTKYMTKEKREYFKQFYKEQYEKYPKNDFVMEGVYVRKPMVNRIISQKIQNMILEDLYINTNLLDGKKDDRLFEDLLNHSEAWANVILGDVGEWEL